MGVIIPEGFGQAKIVTKLVGGVESQICTFGYNPDIAYEAPDAAALAIFNVLIGGGRPCQASMMGTEWVFIGVDVTYMTPSGPIEGTKQVPTTGTSTMSTCPANSSLILKKITGRGGRKGRGRMFIPPYGVNETNVGANGVINAGVVTAQQTSWGAAFTAFPIAGIQPVLLHSDGSAPDNITAVTIETSIGTQRRRLRR
jgi:hypothetical protein